MANQRVPLGDYIAELLAALSRDEMDEGEVLELGVRTAKGAIESIQARRLEVSSPIMLQKLQRAKKKLLVFLRETGEAPEEEPDPIAALATEDDDD